MARIETDPNYTAPTFSRATAATDAFKKEDVQGVAAALSTHVHDGVHGLALVAGSIPNGTITSAMIADGTIDSADLKDGSVTSAKIADGTIATVDIANAAVTNAKLGSDTARANLLTNGGFEIWQRGNGPFTVSSYGPDRWLLAITAGSAMSVSRDTTNVDPNGSGAAAAVTYTHVAESYLAQISIESWSQLRGKTITFSVRVRTSTASAVRPLVAVPGGGGNVYGGYHTGDGTWQTLTVTTPVSGSTTGLNVDIAFDASCTAYIDNAMLVVGSVPADYAPLHPADDLARCLRYYYILGSIPSGMPITVGQVGTTTAAFYALQTPASFAVTPTLTISSATHFQTWSASTAGLALASGPTLSNFAPPGLVYLAATVASGLVVGNASALISANPLAKMAFEANP